MLVKSFALTLLFRSKIYQTCPSNKHEISIYAYDRNTIIQKDITKYM